MLAGKIYLRSDGGLVAMREAAYDAEDILRELVAHYPDLLAGDQMRPAAPRRWLLIQREAGIEDAVGGLARWSLDHLFLDQDARFRTRSGDHHGIAARGQPFNSIAASWRRLSPGTYIRTPGSRTRKSGDTYSVWVGAGLTVSSSCG